MSTDDLMLMAAGCLALLGIFLISLRRSPASVPSAVGPFRRFWVYMSGQALDLAIANDEVNLYVRYGCLTFVSTLLGFCIGFTFVFYAVFAVSLGAELSRLALCTLAGAILARAVLALDQFIITQVAEKGGGWSKLGNFVARAAVSGALALLGVWSLMIPLAHSVIDQYLGSHRHISVNAQLVANEQASRTQLRDLKQTIASDQAALTIAQNEMSAEEQGRGPSGIKGCGPACLSDNAAVGAAQTQLDQDRAKLAGFESAVSNATKAAGANIAHQKAQPIKADIFARHSALDAVEKTNHGVRDLDWLLTFVILAIDLSPVLMKTFSERSATDDYVLAERRKRHIHNNWRISVAETAATEATPAAVSYARLALEETAKLEADKTARDARARAGAEPGDSAVVRPLYRRRLGLAALAFVLLVTGTVIGVNEHRPTSSSAATVIASNGPTTVALPDRGTLLVPQGSITPGARVTVTVINRTTKTSGDDTVLPPPASSGDALSAANSTAKLVAASPAIKLGVQGGTVLGKMTMTYPVPRSSHRKGRPTIATFSTTKRAWMPLTSSYDRSKALVSATLTHFSSYIDAFRDPDPLLTADEPGQIQTAIELLGIGTPAPSCPNPPPSWLTSSSSTPPLNPPVQDCLRSDSSGPNVVAVEITNNRPWGQMVTVSGAPLAFAWEDNNMNELHDLGVLMSDNGATLFGSPSTMYLAGKGHMTLGFTRGNWTKVSIMTTTDAQSSILDLVTKAIPVNKISTQTWTDYLKDAITKAANKVPIVSTFVSLASSIQNLGHTFNVAAIAATAKLVIEDLKAAVINSGIQGELDDTTVDNLSSALDAASDLDGLVAGAAALANLATGAVLHGLAIAGLDDGTIKLTASALSSAGSPAAATSSPGSAQAPPAGLTFSVTGTCTTTGGTLNSASGGFTPGGHYSLTADYPDGAPYTNLIPGGAVHPDGSVVWTWPCAGDPAGTYTTTLIDSATGRSTGPVHFVIGSSAAQSTTTTTTIPTTTTGASTTTTTTGGSTTTSAPPQTMDAYNNYGPANEPGHAVCRGNPNESQSMPGGVVTQSFTVPSGIADLDSATIQIDPDSTVTATLTVSDGGASVTASSPAGGDTVFNFPAISVNPGDTVTLTLSFSSTYGKIITVYDAGNPGGTMTVSNSCPDGAPNYTTTNSGLRATVSGMS